MAFVGDGHGVPCPYGREKAQCGRGYPYGRTQNDENLQPPRRSYALRFQNPHSREWLCHTGRGDVDSQAGWCGRWGAESLTSAPTYIVGAGPFGGAQGKQ